ncbi:hypothetical protein Tco_0849604, partial [Tanacetum coccineum]
CKDPFSYLGPSTSLSNSAPDGVITMELAKGSILNEEMRRKSQGSVGKIDCNRLNTGSITVKSGRDS